jgi:hypothetical protein
MLALGLREQRRGTKKMQCNCEHLIYLRCQVIRAPYKAVSFLPTISIFVEVVAHVYAFVRGI